jgi:hypothetical protein
MLFLVLDRYPTCQLDIAFGGEGNDLRSWRPRRLRWLVRLIPSSNPTCLMHYLVNLSGNLLVSFPHLATTRPDSVPVIPAQSFVRSLRPSCNPRVISLRISRWRTRNKRPSVALSFFVPSNSAPWVRERRHVISASWARSSKTAVYPLA